MRWLKTVVQILCLLPLITGALDLVLGARVLSAAGAALSGWDIYTRFRGDSNA